MIRVLHILHSMNRGGAENAIMNYYRHIDRELVQFDFLLTEENKCSFEDEINSLGGYVYRVPQLTVSHPYKYITHVNRFFKTHPEYQIVHSHTNSKSAIPLALAKWNHIPIRIAHSHNNGSRKSFQNTIREVLKSPLKSVATHLMACGDEAAIWLYGRKILDLDGVTILHNVIESSPFEFSPHVRSITRERLGIADNCIVLGCTARFSYQKNHAFLLDIFKAYNDSYPNSRLLLVGDGEEKPVLMQKITDLQIDNKVIMTGVVDNVADYEQAMDAFVMTSFYEGLPLSIIEAQIIGLPCYVSDCITRESDLTGLVSFISLEKDANYWAKSIHDGMSRKRRSYLPEIQQAGYDAATSAVKLQEFYLNCMNHVTKQRHLS